MSPKDQHKPVVGKELPPAKHNNQQWVPLGDLPITAATAFLHPGCHYDRSGLLRQLDQFNDELRSEPDINWFANSIFLRDLNNGAADGTPGNCFIKKSGEEEYQNLWGKACTVHHLSANHSDRAEPVQRHLREQYGLTDAQLRVISGVHQGAIEMISSPFTACDQMPYGEYMLVPYDGFNRPDGEPRLQSKIEVNPQSGNVTIQLSSSSCLVPSGQMGSESPTDPMSYYYAVGATFDKTGKLVEGSEYQQRYVDAPDEVLDRLAVTDSIQSLILQYDPMRSLDPTSAQSWKPRKISYGEVSLAQAYMHARASGLVTLTAGLSTEEAALHLEAFTNDCNIIANTLSLCEQAINKFYQDDDVQARKTKLIESIEEQIRKRLQQQENPWAEGQEPEAFNQEQHFEAHLNGIYGDILDVFAAEKNQQGQSLFAAVARNSADISHNANVPEEDKEIISVLQRQMKKKDEVLFLGTLSRSHASFIKDFVKHYLQELNERENQFRYRDVLWMGYTRDQKITAIRKLFDAMIAHHLDPAKKDQAPFDALDAETQKVLQDGRCGEFLRQHPKTVFFKTNFAANEGTDESNRPIGQIRGKLAALKAGQGHEYAAAAHGALYAALAGKLEDYINALDKRKEAYGNTWSLPLWGTVNWGYSKAEKVYAVNALCDVLAKPNPEYSPIDDPRLDSKTLDILKNGRLWGECLKPSLSVLQQKPVGGARNPAQSPASGAVRGQGGQPKM